MPILKKNPDVKTVLLPESQITVGLGITWKERNAIQNIWLDGLTLDPETNKPKGDISADIMDKQRNLSLELCVKSWDATDEDGKALPCTLENLGLLSPADGDALTKAIDGLLAQTNSKDVKKD